MAEENQQPTIEELQKRLEECRKLQEEYLAGWQRQKADFVNFKKDQQKLFEDLGQAARVELVLQLLPIIDSFDLASSNIPPETEIQEWTRGLEQILVQVKSFLEANGVQEIPSDGERFNPEIHEVVEAIEKEGAEPDIIIQTIQKGYTTQGKVIRPAKVKVVK